MPECCDLFHLPQEIVEKILLYLTYDEIAQYRIVCRSFNRTCGELLNRGFLQVVRRQQLCLRRVKTLLPRRESERRTHRLSKNCEILSSIETRLNMLEMTYLKWMDLGLCCFIPGKVVDEVFRVLRVVENTNSPPRTHEVLQELRDLTSMAMEHFDEHIAPNFVVQNNQMAVQGGSGRQIPRFLIKENISKEFQRLRQKNSRNAHNVSHLKSLIDKLTNTVHNQNRVITKQTRKIAQQNANISDLRRKIEEMDKKVTLNIKNQMEAQKNRSFGENLDNPDHHFNHPNQKIDNLDTQFDHPDLKLDNSDSQLHHPNLELDNPDPKLDYLNTKLDNPDSILDNPNQKLEFGNEKLEKNKQNQKTLKESKKRPSDFKIAESETPKKRPKFEILQNIQVCAPRDVKTVPNIQNTPPEEPIFSGEISKNDLDDVQKNVDLKKTQNNPNTNQKTPIFYGESSNAQKNIENTQKEPKFKTRLCFSNCQQKIARFASNGSTVIENSQIEASKKPRGISKNDFDVKNFENSPPKTTQKRKIVQKIIKTPKNSPKNTESNQIEAQNTQNSLLGGSKTTSNDKITQKFDAKLVNNPNLVRKIIKKTNKSQYFVFLRPKNQKSRKVYQRISFLSFRSRISGRKRVFRGNLPQNFSVKRANKELLPQTERILIPKHEIEGPNGQLESQKGEILEKTQEFGLENCEIGLRIAQNRHPNAQSIRSRPRICGNTLKIAQNTVLNQPKRVKIGQNIVHFGQNPEISAQNKNISDLNNLETPRLGANVKNLNNLCENISKLGLNDPKNLQTPKKLFKKPYVVYKSRFYQKLRLLEAKNMFKSGDNTQKASNLRYKAQIQARKSRIAQIFGQSMKRYGDLGAQNEVSSAKNGQNCQDLGNLAQKEGEDSSETCNLCPNQAKYTGLTTEIGQNQDFAQKNVLTVFEDSTKNRQNMSFLSPSLERIVRSPIGSLEARKIKKEMNISKINNSPATNN